LNAHPQLGRVHDRMAAAVGSGDPLVAELYAWLRYQLGWAEADGTPAGHRRGKGLRPTLALVSCEAVGGDPAQAVPVASALELTHEFSLVHDDIEDGDELRRGRPALWTVCGLPQGVNAGDVLFGIARREVSASPVSEGVLKDLVRRYDAACIRLAEGQFLDLRFETRDKVGVEAYVDMVSRKTGALLGAAAALGARSGGADASTADDMNTFGEALGVAFQMRDDVLGLWGDPAMTGKPAGSDLMRCKRTLPILVALADADLHTEVERLFASPQATSDDASRVAGRMAAGGCLDATMDAARRWGRRATEILARLPLQAGPRAELLAIVAQAVDRER
jgi:geranylgeranyl diphosphate synthase, type I